MNNLTGKKVTWTSQSQGTHKQKTGIVIGHLPAGVSAATLLPAGVKNSRLQLDLVSSKDRIIVEVPRGGKSVLTDFYGPYALSVKVVEG